VTPTPDHTDDRARRYDGYARARLRVRRLDGPALLLEPRPAGECRGVFPFGDAAAHVLTAVDPGPERLDAEENARRQDALVAALPQDVRRWEAVTGAADGTHAETSVLVVGLTDDHARAIAEGWGQDAIFRWTLDGWSILPCDDAAPVHLGWSVSTGR
jgi:hypothetical protein